MSVSNGQRANETTFNDAFLSRTTDSDTVAIIGLNHASSGGLIANAQQTINDNAAAIVVNAGDIVNLFASKEDKVNKGVANGYAELDGTGKIPLTQIPDKFASIEGNWNANTNTPTLIDGTGNLGEIYVVDTAGSQDLGSGSQTFDVGDWVVYNSSNEWIKTINSTAVTSVNTQTGAVVLNFNDINDVNIPSPGVGDDQKAVIWDNATSKYILGSPVGTGSGGINYVTNFDAELTADNHTAYQDAASDTPVDGDGGSPSVSVSRTTITNDLLRGVASFAMSKGGSNLQGEGVHIGLDPIDYRDRYQRLQVSFDFKHPNPGSNFYADGDYKVFVYDVDNATLIGALENDDDGDIPRHVDDGASVIGFFNATDSLNYRLLIHVTTTAVTASAMIYDNVRVAPIGFVGATYQNEEIIDLTGSGNYTGGTIRVSRIGGVVNLTILTALTHASNSFPLSNPILPAWAIPGKDNYNTYDTSTDLKHLMATSTGAIRSFYYDYTGAGVALTTTGAVGSLSYNIENVSNVVSNTKLTQQTLVTSALSQAPTGTIDATFNQTSVFGTVDINDAGSYNTSTGQWTAPRDGRIKVSAGLEILYSSAAGITSGVKVENINNGESITGGDLMEATATVAYPKCSGILNVLKGQIIEVRPFCNGGSPVYTTSFTGSNFSIHYLPDFKNYGVLNPNSELIESIGSAAYSITAGQWGDLTSIVLTPGTWDVSVITVFDGNASANTAYTGLSITPGNSAAGLISADTSVQVYIGAGLSDTLNVDKKDIVITADTTYYLKAYQGVTSGAPTAAYKLSARRIK